MLIAIISTIILIGAVVVALAALLGAAVGAGDFTGDFTSPGDLEELVGAFIGVIAIIVLVFFIIIVMYVLYLHYIKLASDTLKKINSELGIGGTGVILGYIGIVFMFLGGVILGIGLVALAETTPDAGLAGLGILIGGLGLLAIGAIITVVGEILISIMFLRIDSLRYEGLPVRGSWTTVGVLMLVATVVQFIPSEVTAIIGGILGFVAYILAYIYAGDTIAAARRSLQAGGPTGGA